MTMLLDAFVYAIVAVPACMVGAYLLYNGARGRIEGLGRDSSLQRVSLSLYLGSGSGYRGIFRSLRFQFRQACFNCGDCIGEAGYCGGKGIESY